MTVSYTDAINGLLVPVMERFLKQQEDCIETAEFFKRNNYVVKNMHSIYDPRNRVKFYNPHFLL